MDGLDWPSRRNWMDRSGRICFGYRGDGVDRSGRPNGTDGSGWFSGRDRSDRMDWMDRCFRHTRH